MATGLEIGAALELADKAQQKIGNTVSGVMALVQSRKQAKEANELEANNPRPEYEISQNLKDNLSLTTNRASQGMSDVAMNAYQNMSNRSLTTSVDAIIRGGGSVNNIADLYDAAGDNFEQLAMLEEELRMKRERDLITQNQIMAKEQDKEWMINEFAPYQDTKQLVASLRQQSNDNKWKAVNQLVGGNNYNAMGKMYGGGGGDLSSVIMSLLNNGGGSDIAGLAAGAGKAGAGLSGGASSGGVNLSALATMMSDNNSNSPNSSNVFSQIINSKNKRWGQSNY